jgi:endonuclease-3
MSWFLPCSPTATRNADSSRAYRTLRERFASWDAVRDAPVLEVQEAIAACTWPEAKAPALQRTLRVITERIGALDLSVLAGMPDEEARAWLESLPGVGPKTSAAVLSFSNLRRRALPVDSHHHRVAQRLGLIPVGMAVGPAHRVLEAMLPPEWNAQQVYDNHEVLMLHGQKVCFFRAPACGRCVLLGPLPDRPGPSRGAGCAVTAPLARAGLVSPRHPAQGFNQEIARTGEQEWIAARFWV